MPLVTVFNLRREDRLSDLEEATRRALTSMPELAINDHEIDLVPVLRPDDFDGEVTRINVDLWERAERTTEALQHRGARARSVGGVGQRSSPVSCPVRASAATAVPSRRPPRPCRAPRAGSHQP